MSYKHKCAYGGEIVLNGSVIPECKNEVTTNKIFCRECFQLVAPAMRQAWRVAFPYDVPYEIATKPNHEDQKKAIQEFRKAITEAKLQISLF